MCLYVDKQKTEQEKANSSPRRFLKAFIRKEDYLVTPYMKHVVEGPGIIENQKNKGIFVWPVDFIGPAFHARTTGQALKQDLFWIDQFELGFCVVLEITVQAGDIIAFGNQDNVALTKYEITAVEWGRAFKTKEDLTLKNIQKRLS